MRLDTALWRAIAVYRLAALLYAAGALLLLGLHGRFRVHRDPVAKPSVRRELAEGVRFVFGHRLIRTLTVVAGLSNAANSAYFAVFVLWVVGPESAMGLRGQPRPGDPGRLADVLA